MHTGLRRGEINALHGDDFHLDTANPYWMLPAAFVKNRKEQPRPLHPELVAELQKLKAAGKLKPEDLVFPDGVPTMKEIRKDFKKAEIPLKDERGHVGDFHALRTTYITRLQRAGVSPREAMELQMLQPPFLQVRLQGPQFSEAPSRKERPWQYVFASLTKQNLDLDSKEVRLTTSKKGRRQNLPLAGPLLRYIKKLPISDDPAAPLFPNAMTMVQRQRRAGNLSNQFHKILVAAGLADKRSHHSTGKGRNVSRKQNEISFHSLRHTATTLLKAAGVSDAVARKFIGYDSPTVSKQYSTSPPTHSGRRQINCRIFSNDWQADVHRQMMGMSQCNDTGVKYCLPYKTLKLTVTVIADANHQMQQPHQFLCPPFASSKHWLKPGRNRFCQKRRPSVLKCCRQTVWRSQVVVVKDEDAGKFLNRLFEIAHGARKPGVQFIDWHIMSALTDSHGNACFRTVGIGEANETQNHGVTLLCSIFQKRQFVAHGIGKHRLEYETLSLTDKFLPQFGGNFSRLISINAQFSSQNIRVDKAQATGFEMGFVKCGFPRSIRSRHGDNYRTPIQTGNDSRYFRQGLFHLEAPTKTGFAFFFAAILTGRNCRFTNRPTVRLPSASIRTSKPGDSAAAS
jgi:integrase